MTEHQSIKETLDVIRKALETDTDNNIEDNKEDNQEDILLLNQLVNEDGTINFIESQKLSKNETVNILNKKLDSLFEESLVKWLDNNVPLYLEKYFENKKV